MSSVPPCPVCAAGTGSIFFELGSQPVLIGLLWEEAGAARSCRKGDISLAFCPECGFVWNTRFDPGLLDYDQRYDNSLHFSPTFQAYTETLVARLAETYALQGKTIVDIGCGKGDFLALLCAAGANRGYGFDPSFEGERPSGPGFERVVWSNSYYSEEHAKLQADLLTSRFVFEHIPDPIAFLRMIHRSIPDPSRTAIYFEVPNIDLIVRQGSVWDIIYEHCSYFAPASLARAFTESGFDVLRTDEPYQQQFLSIEARANPAGAGSSPGTGENLAQLRAQVRSFAQGQQQKRETWRERLQQWQQEGRSVAIWGGGAKAVGFLNMLQDRSVIRQVIDINPFKRGKFLPGTGQRIVSPEDLAADPPDTVVLMNPIYRSEVEQSLARMGMGPVLFEA